MASKGKTAGAIAGDGKPPLFMITNRNVEKDGLGKELDSQTRYYECAIDADPATFASWKEQDKDAFIAKLRKLAQRFVRVDEEHNEDQQHISMFVHGFNVDWVSAATRYAQIKTDLFDAKDLGVLILFTWPSNGTPAGYLPDREDARDSAAAVADLVVFLNDYLTEQQRKAAEAQDPKKLCRAKLSVIAHSMGNYVIEKALAVGAKRVNSPQLITLIHQLVMVAADVDNDLFQRDKPGDSDGSLMANLCYRIGALYTGLDQVLGASAGLKHFGTRRLGRSGLADGNNVWDNVFALDVTKLVAGLKNTHSAVFDSPDALALVERMLRGVDRALLLPDQPA
jgi:esterase/lipase superfamily enzyme